MHAEGEIDQVPLEFHARLIDPLDPRVTEMPHIRCRRLRAARGVELHLPASLKREKADHYVAVLVGDVT